MALIHPDAAGIDFGAEHHLVAVPADRREAPVRTFGCTTPQLEAMAGRLLSCGITTVAMESTGVTWIPVAEVLDREGLHVFVVDARPGLKSSET